MTIYNYDNGDMPLFSREEVTLTARLLSMGDEFHLRDAVVGRQYSVEFTTGFLYVVVIQGSRHAGTRFYGLTVTTFTTEPSHTFASPVIRVGEKWLINGRETVGTVKSIHALVP